MTASYLFMLLYTYLLLLQLAKYLFHKNSDGSKIVRKLSTLQ